VAPDPVLVGAGDIASCALPDDENTAKLLEQIPGQVFTAGDNAYDSGSAQEFADCYDPTWGQFKDRTRPALGNNDALTRDAQGYFEYFGAAAGPAPGGWYSYDLGAWHIIVLNSNCPGQGGCSVDSDQGKWLTQDVSADHALCTAAIWHAPRFSSGSEHGNDPAMGPFWDLLYAKGVDVVINGHDHDYERFTPQNPSAGRDDSRGIVEFVVGTGGAALRIFDAPKPNSLIRSNLAHGVLRLILHKGGYDFEFITVGAAFGDRGSGDCH
jgi:hypothetical protein